MHRDSKREREESESVYVYTAYTGTWLIHVGHDSFLWTTDVTDSCGTWPIRASVRPGLADTKSVCVIHCNTLQHTATHCNTLQHTDYVDMSDKGHPCETQTWLIHVWHGSFIYVTRLIHTSISTSEIGWHHLHGPAYLMRLEHFDWSIVWWRDMCMSIYIRCMYVYTYIRASRTLRLEYRVMMWYMYKCIYTIYVCIYLHSCVSNTSTGVSYDYVICISIYIRHMNVYTYIHVSQTLQLEYHVSMWYVYKYIYTIYVCTYLHSCVSNTSTGVSCDMYMHIYIYAYTI